jgi:putative acetyltransferase
MIQIRSAADPPSIAIARRLFLDYQQALGVDLSFQGFASEVATLPGAYASPTGRLLLADDEGVAVGCVALRALADRDCEMKRLFVRMDRRASGVGRLLVERIIEEARSIGYARVLLDTLPSMSGAQRLYERFGFRDVPPYRHNPIAGTRFMGLDLQRPP